MTESTEALPATPSRPGSSRFVLRPSVREALWGYVFIGPWLIGLLLFTAGPIIASFAMSLTNFDLLHADQIRFVGLDNYIHMTTDPLVAISLIVDPQVRRHRGPGDDAREPRVRPATQPPRTWLGKGAIRALVYMPIMIPLVASTLVWSGLPQLEHGLAQPDHRVPRSPRSRLDQQRDLDLSGPDAHRACGPSATS